MKKSILFIAFSLLSMAVFAQVSESYPYWTISKDVQKMQFKNKVHTPSAVTTSTKVLSSKGIVILQQRRETSRPTVIRMEGMPSSVISKGVARMQYENSNK
jgi:hypothetical protein